MAHLPPEPVDSQGTISPRCNLMSLATWDLAHGVSAHGIGWRPNGDRTPPNRRATHLTDTHDSVTQLEAIWLDSHFCF